MSLMNRKPFCGGLLVVFSLVSFMWMYKPHWNQIFYFQDQNLTNSSRLINETTGNSHTKESLRTSVRRVHDLTTKEVVPFHRIDDTPERTKNLPFLKSFKNPCWREVTNHNSSAIRCLPYFYQVGPPKCGTTDLCYRLLEHPKISSTVKKELQWIAKRRFRKGNEKLSKYLGLLDNAVKRDIIPSHEHGYYDAIIGDFSPSTIWFTEHYWKSPSSKFTSNADVIHHLNPDTKIIVTLRNPVTRAYSDFKHFTRNASPKLFHERVVSATSKFDSLCGKATNLRRCVDLFPDKRMARLFIGIYYVWLEDYMRVFPRKQIYISKLEERSQNMSSALQEIFSFLEIQSLPENVVEDIVSKPLRAKDTHRVAPMLEKTKYLLEKFFKPFNEKLGDLIGQKFNYNLNG